MGLFVNPDNTAFQTTVNSKIYIDKTGLLEYTNSVISTDNAFICNSRPRRFGKSITANMLSAYYSKGAVSDEIFSGLDISSKSDFKKHLNKYDTIHLDIQWCMMDAGSPEATIDYINSHVIDELQESYPDVALKNTRNIYGALSQIYSATGSKFIIIIDEWDVLIRDEASNKKVQTEYINFLRGMFKGNIPTSFVALAFLTGILPIKKIQTQSALNNFDEFTMLDSGMLSQYIGFTEQEVHELCKLYKADFNKIKQWYDGYLLGNYEIYNPKAVVNVITRGNFRSYWSQTGTYKSIIPLINMDFDGLKSSIIEMLSGNFVTVDTNSFQNDTVSFSDKDDILTYLIHLGYLGYNPDNQTAFIPNEEIRQEFINITKRKKWNELAAFNQESELLLDATLDMDNKAVAQIIEKIHTDYASAIQYNNENSLSSVITIGYLCTLKYYFKPVRELPTGRGFADFVYIPKPEYINDYPALLIELKWNKNAQTALNQIKDKKYPAAIEQYTGKILLVGITYDKKTKDHSCIVENLSLSK